jgi:hypothetical protein
MLGRNKLHNFLVSLMILALMTIYSDIVFARTITVGSVIVSGKVTVNGRQIVSNSKIVSDSKIISGANSGAVISFGPNGSVELSKDTSVILKYTKNSIVIMLTSGKIRVMNARGVDAIVATRTATIVADKSSASNFAVSSGFSNGTECKGGLVETFAGSVTVRTIDNQTPKAISAGGSVQTQTNCQPCPRPGSAPPVSIVSGLKRKFKRIFGW